MVCDILACYGSTPIDRFIQWGLGERVTHIAIEIDDGLIIETGWFGVKVSPLSIKANNFYRLRCDILTEEDKHCIISFLVRNLGVPYDYKLFTGITLNRLFGLHTKWNDTTKYLCDEVALNAWRYAGYELLPGIDDSIIVPSDLTKSTLLREVA